MKCALLVTWDAPDDSGESDFLHILEIIRKPMTQVPGTDQLQARGFINARAQDIHDFSQFLGALAREENNSAGG